MMGLFFVANQPTILLFDSGASHTFISRSFVVEHQLLIETMEDSLCVQSPGRRLVTKEVVYQIPIELVGHTFPTNLIVLKG